MLRQMMSLKVAFVFLVVFTSYQNHAFAECAEASDFASAQEESEGAQPVEDPSQQSQVDDQGMALKDNCDAGMDTSNDMTDPSAGGGGGGGGGMLGGLMGGALGALGAMMAANKTKKDLNKKLDEAAEAAREAEKKAEEKIDKKFAEAARKQEEAAKKQEKQMEKFKEELTEELKDELKADVDVNQGDEPTIGANGLAADIENAFASGDLSQVSAIINDPLNRERLPAEYIAEIEQRLMASGGGEESSRAFAGEELIGASEDSEKSAISGLEGLAGETGGERAPTAYIRASVGQLMEDDQLDILRDKILNLIHSGSMASLNAAAKHIDKLSLENDPQIVGLSDELRIVLNSKLENMGLPGGPIGLSLLSN